MSNDQDNSVANVVFGRDTQHNPDRFWNSSGRRCWNAVMAPDLLFDNIGLSDLEGDHAAQLLTEFCLRCKSRPPLSQNNQPYAFATLQQTLSAAARMIDKKFRKDNTSFFLESDLRQWKSQLKGDHSRNHMQGADESDVLKTSFPIPRDHAAQNELIPFDQIPNFSSTSSAKVTMKSVSMELFKKADFCSSLKLLFTFFGIGRGGEVKFLNYDKWFLCLTYNTLFVQWFQRKTLKSNPSAFLPDYECPQMSIWLLLGCY